MHIFLILNLTIILVLFNLKTLEVGVMLTIYISILYIFNKETIACNSFNLDFKGVWD